jgi:hypothetical protein
MKVWNGSSFVSLGTTSTITTAEPLSFQNVMSESKIYFSSSNNALMYWDGGVGGLTALASSVPHGDRIFWYQNHLFQIGSVNISGTKYYNRIYWSDFGDPETYTADNFVELAGEGKTTTCNGLGNSLVVFRERSYHVLEGYGSNSWKLTASSTSIDNIDSSVGTRSPKGTVRVSANELWFIDNQGRIRRLTQADYGYESRVMSTNLEGYALNTGALDKAIAAYDDDFVYFAVASAGSSENDTVFVFDRIASSRNGGDEAWTVYTGWQIRDLVTYGTTPTLHILSSTKVYEHGGGDDDGVAIACIWEGKNDDYDKEERYKKYAYGYLNTQAQNSQEIRITSNVDGVGKTILKTFSPESTGTPLGPTGSATMGPTGSFVLGGSGDLQIKYYFADGNGKITGKTVMMGIEADLTEQTYIDTFTNHFMERSLR